MREMNLDMLAMLEGCLPDEFIIRKCICCGEIFEIETGNLALFCSDCAIEAGNVQESDLCNSKG
jgi:hypothetical protein